MGNLLLILGSALSSIKRTPLISLLAAGMIAIGIGISLPMMTVYHNMQQDPIPDKSSQLFRVQLDNWSPGEPFREPNEPPNFVSYQDSRNLRRSTLPRAQAAMFGATVSIDSEKPGIRPFNATARITDRDFFTMFNVPFSAGGPWSVQEENNTEDVIVISQILRQRLFGAEAALGKTIRVKDRHFTVVGVLAPWHLTPKFYDMVDPFAPVEDLYLPYSGFLSRLIEPEYWRSPYPLEKSLNDVTFESIFAGTEAVFAQYWVELTNADIPRYREFLATYVSEQKALGRFPREANNRLLNVTQWIEKRMIESDDAGGVVALLVVMLLFFVVCLLNSMNVLLTKFIRAKARVAMLRCLGASQQFIFAQHILEVTIFAIIGGAFGLFLATIGLDAAQSLFDQDAAQGARLIAGETYDGFWHLDRTMIFVSFALALAGGWLAGLYPAWRICRMPPSSEIKTL